MAVDLSAFAGQYPQPVLDAVQALFDSKPDQLQSFQQNYGGDLKSFLDATVGWWSDNGKNVGADLAPYAPEFKLLDALGYQVNPAAITTQQNLTPGSGTPLEQQLLQQALPGLTGDINQDANRRALADALANAAVTGAGAATTQLGRTQGGHFDGRAYFAQNPDVANAFNALPPGATPDTKKNYNGQDVTADQFAEQHYLQFGQSEGRQPDYVQSAQLAQDFNNANQTVASNVASANQATQTQLAALGQATAQLQQNLTGDLAAKAAALQTQLASLNQNLDTLDATQRQALTTQIATQQRDLEQSITTQRQALQDQIAALGNAADAESQAKRASLNTEIQALTAAQAPLNAARSAAAELQATAVNVGLQRTQDQLTADNARAGFVGGSTAQDNALNRSTIDARQQAAQAVGNANVANASDTRDIGVRGATGQRSIADALAEAQRNITGQGATGNAALTTAGAVGRQQLGDLGAVGQAGITNQTALSRAGIGAFGANTAAANATTGADQGRSIADALAQGQYGLTSTNALNTLAAQQQGAAARATYYDNDYNRSLSAALAPGQIATGLAGGLTALDNYATSGLNRSLGTLNWWSTNQATPPTQGALATNANQSGNSLSNLGAGLFGAGLNLGAANQWWKTPTTNFSGDYGGYNPGAFNGPGLGTGFSSTPTT